MRSILDQLPETPTSKREAADRTETDKSLRRAIEEVDLAKLREFLLPNIERELAAIVEATGSATQTILSAIERVERATGGGDGKDGMLELTVREAATRIYEACSFQDITGQRMSKIISLLKQIEMRVEGLLGHAGDAAALERYHELKKAKDKEKGAREFLQGPQLGDAAVSQEDIDKLFSD